MVTGARREACNAARSGFELVENCGSAALCRQTDDSARCLEPVCRPGEAECRRRDVLAVCNADGTGFDEIECEDDCDEDQNPPRCVDDNRGRD